MLWIRCAIATFWLPTFFFTDPWIFPPPLGVSVPPTLGITVLTHWEVTWPLSVKRKVEKLVLINYVSYFILFHLLMPFKRGWGVSFTCFACWFRTRHLVFFVTIKATNFLSWKKQAKNLVYVLFSLQGTDWRDKVSNFALSILLRIFSAHLLITMISAREFCDCQSWATFRKLWYY